MKTQDLKFVRGDDRAFRLLVHNPDGTPADLTGARLDLHARIDEADAPVLQLSSENGSIEIAQHRIVLHFTHDATQSAEWETARYDLQLQQAGKRRTILSGKIKLIPDQTRI